MLITRRLQKKYLDTNSFVLVQGSGCIIKGVGPRHMMNNLEAVELVS